ncbi:Peptidoglycan-binding lysin domain protein [Ophiocordyceps sinensis CO18]|uniref:Peptidoglycan-binding lysin domain protein n=1 Tax=Ophiocordyceps sinensis (strain Co18 / CGMCC 3.14243) TaxID=911162 RepID=T5AHP7_OPHSC|nr:Peptidoglycan-binding lysin domain protein [Ophiocordyceps sinensis CO18]
MDFCCTCTAPLSSPAPQAPDRLLPGHRRVDCCGRIICAECLQNNRRFANYCPYCQVSTKPSPLPQGLRDPPAYTSVPSTAPPPYTPFAGDEAPDNKSASEADPEKNLADDTLHFLNHEHDSIASLSLRYGIAASVLRRSNNITSDHLLLGRRTILIPGVGVSLSPRPIESEEEELRRSKIRRFMTLSKVPEYDIALMYLEQSEYDLGAAIKSHLDDDAWEEQCQTAARKGRQGRRRDQRRGLLWRGL